MNVTLTVVGELLMVSVHECAVAVPVAVQPITLLIPEPALAENGFYRLALGDSTQDPNMGNRIGAGPRLDINDAAGFERTGYGLLTVNGKNRVTLGLDSKRGTEGLALSLRRRARGAAD